MSTTAATAADDAEVYFSLLDDLSDDGAINMFLAKHILAEAFGLDKQESAAVLSAWMQTFDKASTAKDRAALAFK